MKIENEIYNELQKQFNELDSKNTSLSSELNNLKNSVGNLENLQSEINLSLEMCDLMDHEVEQELELSMTNIEERLKKLEIEKYLEVSFLMKKKPDYLMKQLNIVQRLEEELNFNVNLNMILDRLVIETR